MKDNFKRLCLLNQQENFGDLFDNLGLAIDHENIYSRKQRKLCAVKLLIYLKALGAVEALS